jgi:hypothetical protein
MGVKMIRQRLELGLVVLSGLAVVGAALFSYGAAAVQSGPPEGAIPVECSQARGKEGADFLRHPDRPICVMSQATFRTLYPEIAEHTDGSSWSG